MSQSYAGASHGVDPEFSLLPPSPRVDFPGRCRRTEPCTPASRGRAAARGDPTRTGFDEVAAREVADPRLFLSDVAHRHGQHLGADRSARIAVATRPMFS